MNDIIAFVPFCKPRWCDDCCNERVRAVREVYDIFVGDTYAQGEREGWDEERIEDAVWRCGEQERKELEMFVRCVEEAEERDERRFGRVGRGEGGEEERRALEEVSGDEGLGVDQRMEGCAVVLDDESSESEEGDYACRDQGDCGFRIRGTAERAVSLARGS